MKRILFLCMAIASLMAFALGPQKMAPIKGSNNGEIMLFHGGRPWQGTEMTNFLVRTGMRVHDFNSTYLDALGGATIKAHITDRVEPVAFDGFTPAFASLNPAIHKAVVFHLIPAESYSKIFTSKRVAQLKAYLEKGGHLIVMRPFPMGVIDELLPVITAEEKTINRTELLFANRPTEKVFQFLPEQLPVYGFYQQATLRPGAVVLSTIRNAKGEEVAPFIARMGVGKGSVTYCNFQRRLQRQMHEYANWAYNTSFFAAVIVDASKVDANPEKLVIRCERPPVRNEIQETAASALQPVLGITDDAQAVIISGNQATFGNGYCLEVLDNGKVNLTSPGKNKPYLINYGVPRVKYANTQAVFDSETAEATEVKQATHTANIKWKFDKMESRGNELVLFYSAPDAAMRWIFKAGKMDLDGRVYQGIGDRVELEKCPLLVNAIEFEGNLDLDEPLFAHRNDCYQPPRGYTAFDMTGKTTATTQYYSGQPFEMIVCKNAVYIGNRSYPDFDRACISRQKGAPYIKTVHDSFLGRIPAPMANHTYWHWLGDGTERAHNDYLAMYQFMRQILRRQAGLKELPGYPVAGYGYLSPSEAKFYAEQVVKKGFRYVYPPMPESPIELIDAPKNLSVYQMIKNAGGSAYIWTAGSYVQGDGGQIYRQHPEWFIRDEKGGILKYFGTYPVIDLNAPGFFEFCEPILKKAFENGVKWVYRDMDGGAAATVNYGKSVSPSGMPAQIRFYQFFHAHDVRVSVEGMNPLALDEYLYRPELYTSFVGKEFSLVGQTPNSGIYGALTLDHFRLAMYGCFPNWCPEGLVFGIERIPDEIVLSKRACSFVPKFNEVLDHVGMPFIRETDFGSVWISDKGGALFFWNPTKKATIHLPEGWKIRGVDGNVLTDVPGDAIYLLER